MNNFVLVEAAGGFLLSCVCIGGEVGRDNAPHVRQFKMFYLTFSRIIIFDDATNEQERVFSHEFASVESLISS